MWRLPPFTTQAKRLAKRDADMESAKQAEATAAKARGPTPPALYPRYTYSTYSTCLLHVPYLLTISTLPYLLTIPTLPAKAREEEWRKQDEARFAREEEDRDAMKRAQEKELEVISENHRQQREAAEAAMKAEQAVLRAEQDRQKVPRQAFIRRRLGRCLLGLRPTGVQP